jgi:sugar phosphate isomerase/epimerase
MMDYSRFSLCQAMSPDSTFEEDLELVSALGVAGTSILESKLRDGEEAKQLEAFEASGLRATACLPSFSSPLPSYPRMIRPGSEDPEERIALMCESVRRLAPFGPDSIVLVTGSSKGRSEVEARRIIVDGLRYVAAVCAELGIPALLEPIRFPGYDASIVRNLPDTLDLLDEVGSENLSVAFDTYHLWDTPDILHLANCHADRIGVVQISDWREPARCMADRLIPGEGQAFLSDLIVALENGGYRGWYDVEIFSDDGRWGTALPDSLWLNPPDEIYRKALSGLESTWLKSGVA